jgi:arabinogalactan oligomer/maltooligosaccharide transport system permease protein
MQFIQRLRKSALVGLGASMLFVLVFSSWMFGAEKSDLQDQARQRLAIIHANGMAQAAASSQADEIGIRLREMQRRDSRIESAIIVSGMQLLASTNPDDGAPRRLKRDEKLLFDLANLIRAARETNQGEEVVRKRTVQVDAADRGHILVTVPYLTNGEFSGILQLKFNSAGFDSADKNSDATVSHWLMIGALLLSALVAGLLLRIDPHQRLDFAKAAAPIVFLLLSSYYQINQFGRLENAFRFANTAIAADYMQAAQQYDQLGLLPLAVQSASANSWDTDLYLRPLNLVTAEGKVDRQMETNSFKNHSGFLWKALFTSDLVGVGILMFFIFGYTARTYVALREHADAYSYVAPALIGMLILVFFPFAYGIILSFTDTTLFNESLPFQDRLIGWGNFKAILGDFNLYERSADGVNWNYQNFYWTLMMTIFWTVTNVTIGVVVGFMLAMALNTDALKGKAIYRVLLILPWAIPNYITALVWRGMFHPQFGVINQIMQMFGLEPVAWFDGVFSSFLTGVVTNGWLSFPFMMVVILGALQSIPKDMYEAAEVEGANRWQRLKYITLPLLRPTLIPAVVLSVVWTFNMFNIIFLVSGGEPGGANEILITKAYKIAFENYQYAYAAAYSTVIFMILLVYGVFQTRVTKATESF